MDRFTYIVYNMGNLYMTTIENDVEEKKYDGNPYSDYLHLYSTFTNHYVCAHIMKRDKQLESTVQFYNGMLNVTDGTRLYKILKA